MPLVVVNQNCPHCHGSLLIDDDGMPVCLSCARPLFSGPAKPTPDDEYARRHGDHFNRRVAHHSKARAVR